MAMNLMVSAELPSTQPVLFATGSCSLGSILVACRGTGVLAISLADTADELVETLKRRFPQAAPGDLKLQCGRALRGAVQLVERPDNPFPLPILLDGTKFQQMVWRALQGIPCGTTVSYRELACRLERPRAVRAVASACAANQIAIAVPCHRVLRSDGSVSGFRWGVSRKIALLRREAALAQRFGS
jgi:AraC family transcriptional regulator of adaptative response/methylated-DNA-[protein]-cysteine methyltransferase